MVGLYGELVELEHWTIDIMC